MYDFIYHVRFIVENEKLNIRIFLSLEDYFTPVYIKTFEALTLKEERSFLPIYHEIEEYLVNKHIVINEEDLNLFHKTLISFNVPLPQINSVALNQYDDDLDQYNHILTPKDIVFLKYLDGKAIKDKRFNSWEEDNKLNTTFLREELVKNKLVTTSNYEYNLTKAKREDLLEVVKLYELEGHGDNKDLIEMIEKKLSTEDIKKYFSGSHYSLTEKGKKVIERSKKIIDFAHSFFRYVHKLPLEEFHLLSIKKSDYDFNGIGRLLMVNSSSDQLKHFDWDSLKKDEEGIDSESVKDDEIINYINKVSVNYNQEEEPENDNINEIKVEDLKEKVTDHSVKEIVIENESVKEEELNNNINIESVEKINQEEVLESDKKDEIEVEDLKEEATDYSVKEIVIEKKPPIYDETTEVDLDEIYFEQDQINLEKIEAYRKKRELYDKSKREKLKKDLNYRSNKRRKKYRVFKWLLYMIFFIILLIGILYLIERFELFHLPFSVRGIIQSLKETINGYKDEVIDFIDYIKAYKND
ncbi:hypothetical protein KHQ81_09735 [Mycoplasmatota bacterium]|nr:hypothetical protein KHQ81_09735 [Mycoplasmatota bacterium]